MTGPTTETCFDMSYTDKQITNFLDSGMSFAHLAGIEDLSRIGSALCHERTVLMEELAAVKAIRAGNTSPRQVQIPFELQPPAAPEALEVQEVQEVKVPEVPEIREEPEEPEKKGRVKGYKRDVCQGTILRLLQVSPMTTEAICAALLGLEPDKIRTPERMNRSLIKAAVTQRIVIFNESDGRWALTLKGQLHTNFLQGGQNLQGKARVAMQDAWQARNRAV